MKAYEHCAQIVGRLRSKSTSFEGEASQLNNFSENGGSVGFKTAFYDYT